MTLDVCGGEIVGVAGVSGNGQMHLAEAIAGLRKVESGSLHIDGWKATNRSVRSIVDHGLAYVPEERNRDGMIKDFSISENLIMRDPGNAAARRSGFFRFGRIERHASRIVEDFDVKTPRRRPLSETSGGNAQKVILARELSREPGVLVVSAADARPRHRRSRVRP
ncbi:MAG: ATP-binding cassette domain-containing protein [Ilumatobacteraceae bacterium]